MTMLAIATDYAASTGCPEPYLKRIAEAGFSHIHWCHQWNTYFEYCDAEIEQISSWLKEFGLALLDLHAPCTDEKFLWSLREYERRGGVELTKNRIKMTGSLGGDAVILHPPAELCQKGWDSLRASLDELHESASRYNVRIAFENLPEQKLLETVRKILSLYAEDYIGVCYDSGHGNFGETTSGLDFLESVKERVIALHLHDNDGTGDQHRIPFAGTIDWDRLTGILASAAYPKCICMEVNLREFECQEKALSEAFAAGARLTDMVEERKGSVQA